MDWIYILISFSACVLLFLYHKSLRKNFNKSRKVSQYKFVKNVRENWKEIRIKSEDCSVINFDTKINKNSATYSMANKDESFFEWISRTPKRIDLVNVSRSKVLCTQKVNGKITNKFSATVDIDSTTVKFKLRIRDYVSVYLPDSFDDENYFIDLEFLYEDVDIEKFK